MDFEGFWIELYPSSPLPENYSLSADFSKV